MVQGIPLGRPLKLVDGYVHGCVNKSLLTRALRTYRDARTISSPYSPQTWMPRSTDLA